ncbi:MAG: hypothetical protein ACYCPQ_06640 [Elusimicrobiota bacterium]
MRKAKKLKLTHRYKNLSGDSKVVSYQMEKDSMTIRFADCSVYLYTNQSANPVNISKMKALALAGKGLGTFIDANVKDRFLRKVR